ncbi:MAG TPA: CHAT domain-containing tetratricopeptide repeat protein [Blastocatellia bacterium]|nr:CHAT domain-containing tetratricopeptide repeat protein [Blastocatellia bacterium]
MTREELAARLSAASEVERASLFAGHASALDVELAYSLKAFFDDAKYSDPARAQGAASALESLADITRDSTIAAISLWAAGVAFLHVTGQAELAVARLEEAAACFGALRLTRLAASTQVNKLHALALLGRYDEAVECGVRARDTFLALGDTLGAAQIEQNLGNINFRRDRYAEAEQLYRASLTRFEQEDDPKQLVLIETCLATALIYQYKFRDAISLYEQALARAEKTGHLVGQAAIECDLGFLALFQGRYDRALDLLETSRRRYAGLGMRHEMAIAEQELADAYLELNLAAEAAAIYERVIPTFAALGLRAEQARALACRGRACLMLGNAREARGWLAEARELYASEGNATGAALVTLTEAQLYQREGDSGSAARLARLAEAQLTEAGSWERLLYARWLRGEAARAVGQIAEAQLLFSRALSDAEAQALPQLAERCLTSLGILAAQSGDNPRAEAYFIRAVELVERLRALLPSDEFRTAFVSDKLIPYVEMVRLCLGDGQPRAAEALHFVERARSRALMEMMGGAIEPRPRSRDSFERELLGRLAGLGEELNWVYRQLNQSPITGTGPTAERRTELREAMRERELATTEILRQLQQHGGLGLSSIEPIESKALQQSLGPETALVEYFSLEGELLAFVVTDEQVEVVRHLAAEDEVAAALGRLHFQIDTLRGGSRELRKHLDQLAARAQRHLMTLYDLLLGSIEDRIGERRLCVVPHRALHYVPFHALHDGDGYVIDRREVVCAPSATVLGHCLAAPRHQLRRALLVGVPDEHAPRVRDEVADLAPMFDESVTLLDDEATLAALAANAPSADVLHLACHGQFRSDNPLFSSLRLADGWLTVRDAYNLDLNCVLVTLSACETGVSAIAPGDELIGLARGFFSAGAPSLLLTLWKVDDEQTASFMSAFYRHLLEVGRPGAALRLAQREIIKSQPHPFFWAPFILLGRW